MGTRQSLGGRSSCLLYLGTVAGLVLAVALAVIVFIVAPERTRQQQAQAQHAQATLDAQARAVQATATVEARTAEIQRAYNAGVAFAAAGDWQKAAEEFSKVVALEPGYKDVATRLAEARTKVDAAKATATAQHEATAAKMLETHYQKGLAYRSMEKWAEAKVEFEAVFAVDPNYEDVQAKLVEAEKKLAEMKTLTPIPLPTPSSTSTIVVTPTPSTVVWKAFPSAIASCEGPKDSSGKPWYEPDFNDSTWTGVELPQENTIPASRDGFYRTTFNLNDFGSVFLNFRSDDGIWIYVNGHSLGHWGGDCHKEGHVDGESIEVTDLVKPGLIHLSVHVSNAWYQGSLMDLDVIVDGLALPRKSKE
jgi:tetratricopeptide (TPR) repeat protein